MILKKKDSREADVAALKRLLTLKLSTKQRTAIENELKFLLAGESNENNSAYYLDFQYKDSKNWVIIHDLRIEHRGRVAQIDHLLINRFLEMYVLESKSYYYGVKITEDGEFQRLNGKYYQAIESPIEQNRRHIKVLSDCIDDKKLAPLRLGIPIPVTFKNYILVSPTSNLIKPKKAPFDLSCVIKADAFISHLVKELDNMSFVTSFASAAKLIGTDTLMEFGRLIARQHKPGSINYAAKFGVTEEGEQEPRAALVVTTPVAKNAVKEPSAPEYVASATRCQECGAEVDKKVVYFCRINKAKFKGHILCRDCQQLPALDPV